MGGRGTFASGNNVAYNYEMVGKIEGVKVLEGIKGSGKHGLPESAHSSAAYIKLDNGVFREMRFYDSDKCLYLEIAYHAEKSITGTQEPILHYHTYDKLFSLSKTGNGGRSKAKPLTLDMIEKYKKYFKGVLL